MGEKAHFFTFMGLFGKTDRNIVLAKGWQVLDPSLCVSVFG